MKQSTKRRLIKFWRQYCLEIALIAGAIAGIIILWVMNNIIQLLT